MCTIQWIQHASFHFAWRSQKLNFLGKRQRGAELSRLSDRFIQESTENKQQTQCTVWVRTGDSLNVTISLWRLQWGFILSLLQLLSQLLICQPEILQQKFILYDNSLKCTYLVRKLMCKHQASYELHLYEAGILLNRFFRVLQLQVFLSQTHVKISSNNQERNLWKYLCGSTNRSGISLDFYTNSHCRAMPTLYQPDQSHHPYAAARIEPLRFPADEKWGQNQQLCDGLK